MQETRFKPGDKVLILDGSHDDLANETTKWLGLFNGLIGTIGTVLVAEMRGVGTRFEREIYQTSESCGFWLHGNWVVAAEEQPNEEISNFLAEFS